MFSQPLRKLFDYFLFTSLYIACCSVLMVYQTTHLLHLQVTRDVYFFVFFSTICSYNFHWYLTPNIETEMIRISWTQQHKTLHLVLFAVGLVASAFYAFRLIEYWFWLGGAVVLTFLYSAPKLPLKPFELLRKIAIGKTIFLAFVWAYVTTFLPIVMSSAAFHTSQLLFCTSRFFLIYSICIPFDYRDRQQDKKEGIISMITYFTETGIDRLFYISLSIFAVTTIALTACGFAWWVVALLLAPGVVLLALYQRSKVEFSDYLYYFVLDGLMMLSALFTSLLSI